VQVRAPVWGHRSSPSASRRRLRALEHAIARDEFVVQYQPVVSLATGRLVALEALLRWEHPRRGRLHPGEFIPIAEQAGLIVDVGRWVVDRVCSQVAEWRRAELVPAVPVGINLSANELGDPEFVDDVVRALAAHDVEATDIAFEVTESAIMRDDAATLAQMRRLDELGIRVAVDDFGVGYCSLNYLRQFDFSVLKIDRSFVAGITSSDTDRAIIRTIVSLAADLGLAVVAEGVESAEQAESLEDVGCRFAQGFHISEPLDADVVSLFATATLVG